MVSMLYVVFLSCFVPTINAIDNGLGLLPPLAWRSWNAFHTDFNQSTIMNMVDELVKKRPSSYGNAGIDEMVSLQDLGYNMIGIDEGWEGCGMGINNTQHYVNGTPAVNSKFPSLKALVDYGHSKGVKMGFYLNGCACGERTEHLINYEGDVNLTHALGFDGVKIDSCGAQRNMTLYAELFNATGSPIIIENCHQGTNFPDGGDPGQMGQGWCPYNFFRTSGDIINVWDRVIENLMSVTKFLSNKGVGAPPTSRPGEPPIYFPPSPPNKHAVQPLSRPGCWAYPDMLEVGRMEGSGQSSAAMSMDESSSHFAAWAVISSPLVLGFDLSNTTRLDNAWPIISHRAAMEVSQSAEESRENPSGALIETWQAMNLPAVVVGCGKSCSSTCTNGNLNCSRWAHANQCEENPGYMRAVCPASCPSSSNQSGWKMTMSSNGLVTTPSGDCLDAAGQLPSIGSGLNWLRTKPCDDDSKSQKWSYENNNLKSVMNGQCLGVESHWLWPQPMVSLMGCGGSKTNVTLHDNGTLSSATHYGCFGVSNVQGPPSSLWRKPMSGGRTAVLMINGAALPQTITINVSQVLDPVELSLMRPTLDTQQDSSSNVDSNNGRDSRTTSSVMAEVTDIWTGKDLGRVSTITRTVPPHGNVFVTLSV